MNRFEGLERDVTYISYCTLRNKIIDILKDDDSVLEVDYLSVLLYLLEDKRSILDMIKRGKENGRKAEDSNTET
jgi:hypothetical protein